MVIFTSSIELLSVKKKHYNRISENLQLIIDSSKTSAPQGQDADVLAILLEAYNNYKRSYASNIRFDPNLNNLSK